MAQLTKEQMYRSAAGIREVFKRIRAHPRAQLDARGLYLAGARFDRESFRKADFRDCDLSGATFVDCDLYRATFAGATLVNFNIISNSALLFDHVSFRGAFIDSAEFTVAVASYPDFSGAILDNVLFHNPRAGVGSWLDMNHAKFHEASLMNVRFHHASIYRASFLRASLEDVSFEGDMLTYVSFNQASLTGNINIANAQLDHVTTAGARGAKNFRG